MGFGYEGRAVGVALSWIEVFESRTGYKHYAGKGRKSTNNPFKLKQCRCYVSLL